MSADVIPLPRAQLAALAPNYEAMRNAIAKCEKVDEIAKLANQAVAAQAYFRQSQDVENEIGASRIRVRAERRLGELLRAMGDSGQRATRSDTLKIGPMSRDATSGPTLADLGIPRDRASRAMQLAAVPEAEFEAALGEPRIAQPRRILDERKAAVVEQPAASPVPIAKTLNLWGRVRDLGSAITGGDVPPIELWRTNLQPFQLDELRRSIPLIVDYLSHIQQELNDE